MRVTYLFGAGASFGSLPLAGELGSGIAESIQSFQMAVEKKYGSPGMPYPEDKRPWPKGPYAKALLQDMFWLSELAAKHATVDTIARKLWFRRDDSDAKLQLRRLLAVLSCYFLYTQSASPSNLRYDSFFASVLLHRQRSYPKLPENVVILTWNYDSLLLKSYREFCSDGVVGAGEPSDFENETIWLNGRAGEVRPVHSLQEWKPFQQYNNAIYSQEGMSVDEMIELHTRFFSRDPTLELRPNLHFAWDRSESVARALPLVPTTSILVVIGYSFPMFNHAIDAELLSAMAPTLSRVVLQTRKDSGASERLRAILRQVIPSGRKSEDVQIVDLENTDYFHIPNELSLQIEKAS